jgi:hypothetical protein
MEQQQEARPAPTVVQEAPAPPVVEGRLAPTFIGIVAVQILVIAALYWAGRYFGSAS